MPLPKRRTSKTRRDKRRTHYKSEIPVWSNCSHCGEEIRPHFACQKCGHYKGRKVLEIKEK